MDHIFEQFAAIGGDLILEANFHEEELARLHQMAEENNYEVLALVLRGDADVLYQRYMNRALNENRHSVHLSTTMNVKEDFLRVTAYLRSEKVAGNAIEVNAADFSYQTDERLLEHMDSFFMQQNKEKGRKRYG